MRKWGREAWLWRCQIREFRSVLRGKQPSIGIDLALQSARNTCDGAGLVDDGAVILAAAMHGSQS